MAKKKDLSHDLCTCVVNAHSGGKGYKAISKKNWMSLYHPYIIKMFNTVKNLDGHGRKRKVSSRVTRKICRDANNNSRITSKALIDTLNQAEETVSRSTVQRILHRGGLHGHRPRKTPLLTQRHQDAHQAFARRQLKNTIKIPRAASEHFVLKVDVLEAGKMDKCKDLSEFDKGKIVMARPLDQSISKTAALVGCSWSAVVSTYQKWSKEGTVVNRGQSWAAKAH
ncbi:hypothetical protein QTP86_025032 [Hemibagrus guttatus]|nr:hypothetical protein QTP86_025032 [Hemibagrus guttatus]